MTMLPSTLRRSVHPRRGFISGMVIGMLVLVGISIISLSLYFTTQARRTQAATAGAQLRQLLLAAPAFAGEELTARGNADRAVAVPVPVEGTELTLTIAKTESATVVTATARLRAYHASQRLEYRQTSAGWTLIDVRLIKSP
jgi:hypothetical protein